MPHIIRRSRKTVTTETWTIVWSEEGDPAPDEMLAELPPPDRSPALPEPPDPNESEAAGPLAGT
jgi:hypothetical protein